VWSPFLLPPAVQRATPHTPQPWWGWPCGCCLRPVTPHSRPALRPTPCPPRTRRRPPRELSTPSPQWWRARAARWRRRRTPIGIVWRGARDVQKENYRASHKNWTSVHQLPLQNHCSIGWGGGSWCSLLEGSPSRRPRARGAGPHDCGGRARTASPRAPQCGVRVLPRSSPARAAPDRGGAPARARGYVPSPYGGHGGGGQGCGRMSGAGPLTVPGGPTGGVPSMEPPTPSPGGRSCGSTPPVGSHPGGVARGAGLRGPGVGALVCPAGAH